MSDEHEAAVRAAGAPLPRECSSPQNVPLGTRAADDLRRAILIGRYKPGERLVEDRLSAEFGIPRVPIREALRTLAGDGLVEVRPNRGATVALISLEGRAISSRCGRCSKA